ncbi:SMC-Scp complex subunit ScpB [Facklamia lactis]|uniref:SMC-Scp complex subunit ScpB n=1 Tax=Facklamia lactis TaxID=2749967 RepID=UPI001F0BD43E|nr:SMC-Scp complex subunit ScpB [Facklamia lactis]
MIRKLAAILFVAGEEGVNFQDLVTVLEEDPELIRESLKELAHHYRSDTFSPIELVQFGERYHLTTQPDLEKVVEQFAQSSLQQKLTRAAIETLAIVAYRQPITRMTVDEIRGVSSQAMLHKLLGRDLIKEIGHLDAPGRPILYGVTDYFLNYFGLTSLDDLPPIEELALNTQTATEELFTRKKWEIDSTETL